MIHRLWLLLILGMGSVSAALAQEAPAAPVTDPVRVEEHYRELLQRDEYRVEPRPDFVTQLGRWAVAALRSLQDSLKKYEYSAHLVRFSYALMWLILVMSAITIVYWGVKLVRWRYSLAEPLFEKARGRAYFAPPETLEPEIRAAVAAQEWPMALVLSWRRLLSLLERRDLVAPDRTRTNWEYVEQLQRQPIPAAANDLCQRLATAYDRYAYGARPMSSAEWIEWDSALHALTQMLKLETPAR